MTAYYLRSVDRRGHTNHVNDISEAISNFEVVRLQSTISSVTVPKPPASCGADMARVTDGRRRSSSSTTSSRVQDTNTECKYSTVNSGLVRHNVNNVFYDPVRRALGLVATGHLGSERRHQDVDRLHGGAGLPSTLYAVDARKTAAPAAPPCGPRRREALPSSTVPARNGRATVAAPVFPATVCAWSIPMMASGCGPASSTVVR